MSSLIEKKRHLVNDVISHISVVTGDVLASEYTDQQSEILDFSRKLADIVIGFKKSELQAWQAEAEIAT